MYKLPEDLESKYRFVTLAALRAEQLQAGAAPRVETSSRKPTVIAQQEISEGMVTAWSPDEEVVDAPADAEGDEEEDE